MAASSGFSTQRERGIMIVSQASYNTLTKIPGVTYLISGGTAMYVPLRADVTQDFTPTVAVPAPSKKKGS